ncbi:MAG: hypothetical protein ACPG7F_11485 [Aggregatilineales bacterium]
MNAEELRKSWNAAVNKSEKHNKELDVKTNLTAGDWRVGGGMW